MKQNKEAFRFEKCFGLGCCGVVDLSRIQVDLSVTSLQREVGYDEITGKTLWGSRKWRRIFRGGTVMLSASQQTWREGKSLAGKANSYVQRSQDTSF